MNNQSFRAAFFLILNIAIFLHSERAITLDTIYGTYTVTEPVIIDLIEHPMMQRLREVNQYGFSYYLDRPLHYNRYDHSVGVFVLLRKYGASECEQIAGFLHDASHGAGSHILDFLFKSGDGINSYQDDHHEEFLIQSGLADTLAHHGIPVATILHKNKEFTMLEQELPDICADRLEYNLTGGLLEGLISPQDIPIILDHLHYGNSRWYFTDSGIARTFAQCPLYMTEHVWTSAKSTVINMLFSDLLRNALDAHVIAPNEILFGTDAVIWNTINTTKNTEITCGLKKVFTQIETFYLSNAQDYDIFVQPKFRGIDPWVKQDDAFHRLTEIDPAFKTEFERVKKLMKTGWYIKYQ